MAYYGAYVSFQLHNAHNRQIADNVASLQYSNSNRISDVVRMQYL